MPNHAALAKSTSPLIYDGTQALCVIYGALVPCKTAFIDAHSPGSQYKENFSIIGAGVSEAADQFVHITPDQDHKIGFNIGAAGQPPACKNSLHSHRSAEVFFILSGTWRFFWGLNGDAGEVILKPGDLFNIPTGIFRGFENVGDQYGMIMSILGGDDAGGGVIWAPHVIEKAQDFGLILGESGRLYDTKKGEKLPTCEAAMPILTKAELKKFAELSVQKIVPDFIARYFDLRALAKHHPQIVIGEKGHIIDRPGFEVDFITESTQLTPYQMPVHEVIMVHCGHWRLELERQTEMFLTAGDVVLIPPHQPRHLYPARAGEGAIYRVHSNDDPA